VDAWHLLAEEMSDFNAELRTWGLLEPAESTERLLLSDASVQCSQFVLPEMDAVGGALQAHLLEPTEFLQGQCVQAARELVDKVLRAHPPDTFLPDQPYFELCGVAASAASSAAGGGSSGGGGRLSPAVGGNGGGDDGAAVAAAAAGKKRSGFSSLLRATTLSGATSSSSSHSHVHSGSGGTGGGIGGVSSSSAAAVDVAELAALNDAREGVALVVSVAQGWDTCKRVRSSLLLQQMLRGAKAMAQHVRVTFCFCTCVFLCL
jgi:hypothetical protein